MTWISTRSGKKIDFFQPDPSQIDVDDIAHGLAAVPRWLGQTTIPYSVAQHSWLCSKMCPRYPLAALLHDAAEAYMGDCPRPLKSLVGPTWHEIELRLQSVIFQRFGLAPGVPLDVKEIDDRLLITERRDLQPLSPKWSWGDNIEPFSWNVVPCSTDQARIMFLETFSQLTG